MFAIPSLLLLLSALGCPAGPGDSEPCECDTDLDTDLDSDTDSDGDTDAWSHCPDGESYAGDSTWSARAEVTAEAVYCGTFDEGRTLEQELAAKAQLRIVEGSYPLPTTPGQVQLTLPLCTRRAPDVGRQGMSGGGQTTVSSSTVSGTSYVVLQGSQPMSDGTHWSLAHLLRLAGDEGNPPEPLLLDGSGFDAESGAGAELWLLPEGCNTGDPSTAFFAPCLDVQRWERQEHQVSFDGGEITLELWIGSSPEGTEPGAFTAARGMLDGAEFAIDNYFQLIYRPEHHHFRRHFAVIFDRPLGDVCALRIEEVEPWEETPTARVSTGDCQLATLGTRTVTAETWTRDDEE